MKGSNLALVYAHCLKLQIYKGFLEELHFYGVLKVADTEKIFANLSELCEVCCCHDNKYFQFTAFEGCVFRNCTD